MARTKSGYGAGRKNYLAELLVERLTGVPTEGFVSSAMQWGIDHEAEARTLYEFETGNRVEEVGFIVHPNIDFAGASPDGLVGEDGMVEIKCPNTATHLDALLGSSIPLKYVSQMQWQMECAGREWCDYMSYDPRMQDPELVMVVRRVRRDEAWASQAVKEVITANDELNEMMRKIEGLKRDRNS